MLRVVTCCRASLTCSCYLYHRQLGCSPPHTTPQRLHSRLFLPSTSPQVHHKSTVSQPSHLVSPHEVDHKDLLTSIADLSPKTLGSSHADLLSQLSSVLLASPEVALEAWEAVGVVAKLVELQDCGISRVEEQARLCSFLLGQPPSYSGRGLRILSIDGGGTRGLIPIVILKHIEELCGQPIHKLVDFVCGTSTGSVLSAMLCLERIDARNCQAYYHNFSTEIFKMNNLMGISRFFFSKHAFYDSKLLEGALRNYRSVNTPFHDTSMKRGVPPMCFVSTVANQPMVAPYLFCNYQHRPSNQQAATHYQRTSEVNTLQAIMASSAAPGFFNEVKLGSNLFLDGGILTNNPCGVAIHEARLLWGRTTPIQSIISLGTGLYRKSRQHKKEKEITSTSLMEKIAKVVGGATDTETVHTILKDVYSPAVYFRFQPDLTEDISIDESKPEKLNLLCNDAEHYISSNQDMLKQAVASLTAQKDRKLKMLLWLDSKWDKIKSKHSV